MRLQTVSISFFRPAGTEHWLINGVICIVDVDSDQCRTNLLPWEVVAVITRWLKATVIPGKFDLEFWLLSPFQQFGDVWTPVSKDFAFARFPVKAAFTFVAWFVVPRVRNCDVGSIYSISYIVACSPEVYEILSAS